MNSDARDPFEVEIIRALDGLRQVPPRDRQKATRGREQFLIQATAAAQAHQAQAGLAAKPDRPARIEEAITTSPVKRLNGWIERIVQPPTQKERFAMIPTLATILVSLTLLFGGAGATVFAAQDSLPDEVLYPVKTWSEDLRLELASAPSSQLDLALSFAHRRLLEMTGLGQGGLPVPAQVAERWQRQMDLALALAAEQTDADLEPLLLRLRDRLQAQDRLMTQLRQHSPDESTPLMAQMQARLRERLRWVEAGIEDPLQFQQHYRHGPGGGAENAPEPGYGPGPGEAPEEGSGNQYGPGPGAGDGREDGSGEQYGPGPGASDGPEDGSGEQYGPGPGQGDGPEDGSGEQYGPGPGAGECTGDCTQQDGGQQNSSSGGNSPNESGGNGGGNGGKP